MIDSPDFKAPIAWEAIEPTQFDALLLPGGHAPGMRQYLGSHALQQKVADFWALERPVAAICHGVLLLARARDGQGNSLLANRKTTSLRKWQERTAWLMTRWWLGDYYRTYAKWVEDEVREHLREPAVQYQPGPLSLLRRGTETDDSAAFVVRDGRYLSARWPGDAFLLARELMGLLENRHNSRENDLQNVVKIGTVSSA
jgi:putative intracellular protease/amidase